MVKMLTLAQFALIGQILAVQNGKDQLFLKHPSVGEANGQLNNEKE